MLVSEVSGVHDTARNEESDGRRVDRRREPGRGSLGGGAIGGPRAGQNPPFETIVKQPGGPQLYAAYRAVCHGKDARGNGPMAKQLKAKVPDLTNIAKRNGGEFPFKTSRAPIAEIVRMVRAKCRSGVRYSLRWSGKRIWAT